MRYHLFPNLIPKKGVCYEILFPYDDETKYFKMEQAWENVLAVLEKAWYKRIFKKDWICWEIVADSKSISYRMWFPSENIAGQVIAKYYSEFPQAEFVKVEVENFDFKEKSHAGTKLKLKRHWSLPFKTYSDDAVDSQSELIAVLENLSEGQKVILQFLVQPVYRTDSTFEKVLDQITENQDEEFEDNRDDIYYDAISTKRSRNLSRINIKGVAFADNQSEAKAIIVGIQNAFGTFSQKQLNSFVAREWWQMIQPIYRYEFKNRIFSLEKKKKKTVLSTRELSILLRTPSKKVTSNSLNRMKMKRTPLPKELQGVNALNDGKIYIGDHSYHGVKTPVYLPLEGLNRHMAIWGGTSMGKSTFLVNFCVDLIKARTNENKIGFAAIDPHGSLAIDILSRIPEEQRHLVRYVRFADGNFPFNIYKVDFQATPDKVAQNIQDVFKRVWSDFWGPNVDDNFINGGIALQKAGKASIPNLQRILEDFQFGKQLISKFDEKKELDRQLIFYFSSLYAMKDRDYQQKVGSTLNKLRKITLSETLNSLFSAHTNGIKWRTGMDEGYFTIFDLSGLTGFEKQLIGSLCLTFLQLAAMSREDSHRKDEFMPLHPIIVDEAPTFMEQSADAIQSFADEARKYNVPVVLGMQGLEGQVPDDVASAIFRNFGFMIAYRVGNEVDRQNIYRNLQVDYLSADDFKEIEPNFAYMRMAVGRETTRPFLVHMKPPTKPYEGDVASVVDELLISVLEEEKVVRSEFEALEEKKKEKEVDVFTLKENVESEKVNLVKTGENGSTLIDVVEQEEQEETEKVETLEEIDVFQLKEAEKVGNVSTEIDIFALKESVNSQNKTTNSHVNNAGDTVPKQTNIVEKKEVDSFG